MVRPDEVQQSLQKIQIWLRKVLSSMPGEGLYRKCRPEGQKKCYFGEGNCHFRAQKSAIPEKHLAGLIALIALQKQKSFVSVFFMRVL
jgi:hypothetical protein